MRKVMMGTLALAAIVWAATAGTLDTAFGTGGTVTDGGADAYYGVAVQSDGKIVAVGQGSDAGENYWRITRFDPDGDVDTAFGTNGHVDLFQLDVTRGAFDVAIDANGKIVATGIGFEEIVSGNGRKQKVETVGGAYVVRLNGDGSLDTGFGDGGKALTALTRPNAMALQSDGKIVVGGYATAGGGGGKGKKGGGGSSSDAFALTRLNTDGSVDTAFGSDGLALDDVSSNDEQIASLAIQSDGKIVVTGGRFLAGADWYLSRYDSSGALDTAFGTDGRVGLGDRSYVAIDSSGRLVVAGDGVSRYSAAGVLDTGFGASGTASLPGAVWAAPVIDANGKILVGTWVLSLNNDEDAVVTRLNSDGTADSGFGSGGDSDAIDFSGNRDFAYALALDGQGRILCCGATTPDGGTVSGEGFLGRFCD